MKTLLENFVCCICSFVLFRPVQLDCGHRFCRSCINDQDSMIIKCPQCKEDTSKDKMFNDRGVENDMAFLCINCRICSWIGLSKNYQDHFIQNHSHQLNNLNVLNSIVLKTREVMKIINEIQNQLQLALTNTKQMADKTSEYCIGIEEKTHPNKIQQRNDDDDHVSYDGTLLLKIREIQKKMIQSDTIITYPPFYTSSAGYKMCVRLYFNGNHSGKSTYVSVDLIIMCGDHDAILPWPFNFQVTFGLYDLVNRKDHIIESFRPDLKSTSFQRPQNKINIAYGSPKFIPREKLLQLNSPYIMDDTIYIKVMVREQTIPICILYNLMNIDQLGLPVHIQEQMIKEAMEKMKTSSLKLHLTLKMRQFS